MRRLVVAALAACALASEAFARSAQSPDGTGSVVVPTLILPNTLTSPVTSGLNPEGHSATPAPAGAEAPDATSEAPYSVEGEESLDPDTN